MNPHQKKKRFLVIVCILILAGCEREQAKETTVKQAPTETDSALSMPPDAPEKPETFTIHGDSRIDNYAWLRDDSRSDPELLAYLEAENDYTDGQLAATESMQERIYEEIVGRIKKDDSSVPAKLDDYWYYDRYEEGLEYPIYARKKDSLEAEEEIILDVNVLAEPHEYYYVANVEVSDDHRILAYADDPVSRRQYTIRFIDLETGKTFDDEIRNTSAAIAWAADNRSLFYVRKHETTLLPYQVYRHQLGTRAADDVLIYEEADVTFYTTVYRSKSRDFIYMHLGSTLSDEVRLLDANKPETGFELFLERQDDHEYSVDDVNGRFFVRSNWEAENFRVMETDLKHSNDRSTWKEVIPHRNDVFLRGVEVFRNYMVINERSEGLRKLRVLPLGEGQEFFIESDEPAYTMYIDDNPEINSEVLRYGYTSMTTPYTIYDYDMVSGKRSLLKQEEVLGEFDANWYGTERFTITARDGAEVPISVVYRKPFKPDNSRPLLVYGYGSYGSSMDPTFSISRLSLIDRGVVYAIAHIRGGQELGRQWYDNGKMFNKINTFTDFIDVTNGLTLKGYGDKEKVFAYGGSAGGLLMGAVINMAPDLYRGVIAAVPFVDIITTMLDESIPLTTGEFDEWGNPKIKEQYEYMLSYSPYDQVTAQGYPNLLVTTGLHDSQVQYWEPAKWVAKLRDLKTDDNVLLLRTDMEVGHGGASGRFKQHKETALKWAFMLSLAGVEG
jgi:oligopeptidase B